MYTLVKRGDRNEYVCKINISKTVCDVVEVMLTLLTEHILDYNDIRKHNQVSREHIKVIIYNNFFWIY